MRKILMSLVALLAMAAAATGPARAQYLHEPPPDYASISRAVGDYPKSETDKFMLDEDYFAVAYAIRKIATFDDNQIKIFNNIDNETRKLCKERTEQAWQDDDECSVNTMLRYFAERKCYDPIYELTAHELGMVVKFMEDVYNAKEYLKEKYDRPRPFYGFWGDGSDVRHYINEYYPVDRWDNYSLKKKDHSYPSGHSVVCYATAMLLNQMMEAKAPAQNTKERQQAVMDAAHRFAMSRVVLGVHHFSDIIASYNAAKALFEQVQSNKQFCDDLAALRKLYRGKGKVDLIELPKFSPRDNDLFIRVAKLNRIHFYCLQHKVTSDAPTVEESSTNRIFDYGYRCGVSDGKDCRQLALWIYGKFENEQDNEK
ncbi:MAG: phosphatase PAP2 family protein [Bacteroidales bacterium]|nr:phosphatase PAP2 family protein [Bacteroidales bacterium]